MAKKKVGHPVTKWTEEKISETVKLIDDYADKNSFPIVAEFAYLNNIRKATLYEIPELAYSLKRLTEKKEFQLEKMGMTGKSNTAFVIFSLKQLGWRDKQEIDLVVNKKVIDELRDKYENK